VTLKIVTLPLKLEGAGKLRLLMSHFAVVGGMCDSAANDRIIRLADEFRFLGFGAGVPGGITP